MRAKARALEKAYAKLEGQLHRTPTDDELAAELDLTDDQLQTTLGQISFVGLVALDEMLSVGGDRGESLTLGDTIADSGEGPVAAYEVEEMRHILAEAINRMPEREKIVLTLYYYEGLTLAEIGQVLGRHREPGVPDPHQGRAAAALADPRRRARTRLTAARRLEPAWPSPACRSVAAHHLPPGRVSSQQGSPGDPIPVMSRCVGALVVLSRAATVGVASAAPVAGAAAAAVGAGPLPCRRCDRRRP